MIGSTAFLTVEGPGVRCAGGPEGTCLATDTHPANLAVETIMPPLFSTATPEVDWVHGSFSEMSAVAMNGVFEEAASEATAEYSCIIP